MANSEAKPRSAPTAPHEVDAGARDRILMAGERLFAERGFNGVSMREISAAAQVNLASIAYYFGSKEGLLSAVYQRHCEPMIEQRLRLLAQARRLPAGERLPAILAAFIRPAFEQVGERGGRTFVRLRAVLSGENSELLERLVSQNFDQSSSNFIAALCECLPHLGRDDVCWRFHFLLGAISYTALGPHRIRSFSGGRCDPSDSAGVIRELIPFLVAGFSAPPAAARPEDSP